jgi:hypothetical protein
VHAWHWHGRRIEFLVGFFFGQGGVLDPDSAGDDEEVA